MKINFYYAIILFLFFGNFFPAHSHDGQINITGTIIDKTCTISSDTQDQNVNLGSIANKDFTGIGVSTRPQSFVIKLENCSESVSGIFVKFNGTADTKNANYLKLDAVAGSATGIAIAILDNNKNLIPLANKSKEYYLDLGENNIVMQFYAKYISVNSLVTSGTANASATFTISYA